RTTARSGHCCRGSAARRAASNSGPAGMLTIPGSLTCCLTSARTSGPTRRIGASGGPGTGHCTRSMACPTCARSWRCCIRRTWTGPMTGPTWRRPGLILQPRPGWRGCWTSWAPAPGLRSSLGGRTAGQRDRARVRVAAGGHPAERDVVAGVVGDHQPGQLGRGGHAVAVQGGDDVTSGQAGLGYGTAGHGADDGGALDAGALAWLGALALLSTGDQDTEKGGGTDVDVSRALAGLDGMGGGQRLVDRDGVAAAGRGLQVELVLGGGVHADDLAGAVDEGAAGV